MFLGSLISQSNNMFASRGNKFIGAWNFADSSCSNIISCGVPGPLNQSVSGGGVFADPSGTLLFDNSNTYLPSFCIRGSVGTYVGLGSRSNFINPLDLSNGFTISGRIAPYTSLSGPGPYISLTSTSNSFRSICFSFGESAYGAVYRDWETDRKSTRLNSSHSAKSRMPSSA